jgi:hypothetical protein
MHNLFRSSRVQRRALVITALLVVTGGGLAVAYWSGSGASTGVATTGTSRLLDLSPGTPTDSLHPGGRADVVLDITNPNTAPTVINSLELDTTHGTAGFAVDGAHGGCGLSALSFAPQRNGGAGWIVPARVGTADGSVELTLTNAVSMDVAAANACQGATFTVYLAAGA